MRILIHVHNFKFFNFADQQFIQVFLNVVPWIQ